MLYRNAWVTTHTIDDETVIDIAASGRCRWKIENENNNVLKNYGYYFDHNFGCGQQHLANLMATLVLLAYLLYTTLDWVDTYYRTVRGLLPSRRIFFEHLRALAVFSSRRHWGHLMRFMVKGLNGTIPGTG
ncbi:conserved protein of unknown function [Methylotuvimicrobium alcaliphilum 20Z]|uniref:Transposase n=1 Tax=Methylotuvimicrobium alcaliphilum (strain DSM 19304 / NCIMB 14124 / VKM B-2133 / 20Z) TaxID=1091494 RepID=G4T326_META2|nr:conserved protein of unknown function [Methylotuvimicrobium alcaliphilum 20Z]